MRFDHVKQILHVPGHNAELVPTGGRERRHLRLNLNKFRSFNWLNLIAPKGIGQWTDQIAHLVTCADDIFHG